MTELEFNLLMVCVSLAVVCTVAVRELVAMRNRYRRCQRLLDRSCAALCESENVRERMWLRGIER